MKNYTQICSLFYMTLCGASDLFPLELQDAEKKLKSRLTKELTGEADHG